jgi:hypothetical protein
MSTQNSTETDPPIDLSLAAAINQGLPIESNSTEQSQRNGELGKGDERMAIDGEEETNEPLNVLPIYCQLLKLDLVYHTRLWKQSTSKDCRNGP